MFEPIEISLIYGRHQTYFESMWFVGVEILDGHNSKTAVSAAQCM